MPGHRISIIGAGVAGLALGRCLLQRGIQATIFEKARLSKNRNNYGVTLDAASYRPLLEFLRVEEGSFRRRVAVDGGEGATVSSSSSPSTSTSTSAPSPPRQAGEDKFRANKNLLETFLAEGLKIKHDHDLRAIEPLPGAIELSFGNHSRHSSPVVVGADGPHSRVRADCGPGDVAFTVLPYATYHGKRSVSRDDWERVFAPAMRGQTVVERRLSGGELFQISVHGVGAQDVGLGYTYSRPAAASPADGGDALYRPGRSKDEAREVPEELFDEIEAHRMALQDSPAFAAMFHPEAMRQDRLVNWLMRSLQMDTPGLGEMAGQGIVLMGDAVHAEPILGGAGANRALEDAMVLAEVLAVEGADLMSFYARRAGVWERSLREAAGRIGEMHGRREAEQGGKASL